MKNVKMYVNEEDLNEEEKRSGKISYKRLVDRVCNNRVLCNNIVNVDESIWDNGITGNLEDMGNIEIFQYYLVDMSEWDVEYAKQFESELIISYSNKLDLYVLMVDHFGTSWDYVMTDIEYTNDYNEAES